MNEVYEELKRSGVTFPSPPKNLDATLVKTEAVFVSQFQILI